MVSNIIYIAIFIAAVAVVMALLAYGFKRNNNPNTTFDARAFLRCEGLETQYRLDKIDTEIRLKRAEHEIFKHISGCESCTHRRVCAKANDMDKVDDYNVKCIERSL